MGLNGTMRTLIVGGSAAVLGVSGLAAVTGGVAGAAKPTITHVTSGSVTCAMTAKAKIAPKLKNNWAHSAHSGDSNPAVVALPDTTFADPSTVVVSAKGKTLSCSGNVSDGVNTASVLAIKITLTQVSGAVDNPPLSPGATCVNLLSGTSEEDTAATYREDLKFKTSGAKLAETSIAGTTITPGGGLGFIIDGGTITGSFASGSSSSQAYIDGDTLASVTAPAATSADPVPPGRCEASLKLKEKKGVPTAKLKSPKGLNKIVVGDNLLAPNNPSTITLSVP